MQRACTGMTPRKIGSTIAVTVLPWRSARWLLPGMRVKRWLGAILAGVTLLALGIAYALVEMYHSVIVPPQWQQALSLLTLQEVPRYGRALLFALVGSFLVAGGLIGLNRSLLSAVRPAGRQDLLALVDRRRRGRAGPRVVAIGGGTGLSTLLRGLKEHTENITAIVTVADDGGSSGRLRRSMGIHPPGDFRQCIIALADTEPLMQSLLEYRFGSGELSGHALGNLFLVALTGITGSFEGALDATSRVLAVSGRIVPATLAHVTLCAELADDQILQGESQVPQARAPIRRVFLSPSDPPAFPEAVSAILAADLVVLGPGSLYTSLLPNLLVPDLAAALAATPALVLYVANVATQPGETDGYQLADHLRALHDVLPIGSIDIVLVNGNQSVPLPQHWGVQYVRPEPVADDGSGRLVSADLVDETRPTRHDPRKLAHTLLATIRDHRRSGRTAA